MYSFVSLCTVVTVHKQQTSWDLNTADFNPNPEVRS